MMKQFIGQKNMITIYSRLGQETAF